MAWTELNLKKWDRRHHFEFFRKFQVPFFSVTDVLTVPSAGRFPKKDLNCWMTYAVTRAAQAQPEFRTRFHGKKLGIWSQVSPSITVLNRLNLPVFCRIPWTTDFAEFRARYAKTIVKARNRTSLFDRTERDDGVLYMTNMPRDTVTSVVHPILDDGWDFVPRFAWGRFYRSGKTMRVALNVQVHHGVADGLHVVRLFEAVEATLGQRR